MTLFFSILAALFTCQNGMLIGILTNEFGLFTSSSNGLKADHEFDVTLIFKNALFFICYFLLLFICIRCTLKALIDFIISCC